MDERERERWEQFCRTGLVSDYLEYRAAVDYHRAVPPGEDVIHADRDQGSGALDQEYGGL